MVMATEIWLDDEKKTLAMMVRRPTGGADDDDDDDDDDDEDAGEAYWAYGMVPHNAAAVRRTDTRGGEWAPRLCMAKG